MAGSPAVPKSRRVCVSSWQHILSKRGCPRHPDSGGAKGGIAAFLQSRDLPNMVLLLGFSSTLARDLLQTLGIPDPVPPLPFPSNTCSRRVGRGRQPEVSMATVGMMCFSARTATSRLVPWGLQVVRRCLRVLHSKCTLTHSNNTHTHTQVLLPQSHVAHNYSDITRSNSCYLQTQMLPTHSNGATLTHVFR